LQSQT